MLQTIYILAGGLDRAHDEYWSNLSEAISHRKKDKILSCFFSQPGEDWDAKVNEFTPFFTRAFGNKADIIAARQDSFVEQVKGADIIYFHGGQTEALIHAMRQYPKIELDFGGKVVIGSSAGANFLSNKYWSARGNSPGVGSGITNLNTMVHFGSQYFKDEVGTIDWKSAENKFQEYIGGDKPITKLAEGKFTIFIKDENN